MTQTLSSKYRAVMLLALAAVALLLGGGRQAYGAFPGTNGKIAYESAVTGNSEIFVMSADGSGQTNLTNDLAGPGQPEDSDPAWSPDGSRIAFTRPDEGHRNVFVMNADGSGEVNLTPGAVTTGQANDGVEPTWSPDGTMIAFNSAGNVWTMFANGVGKTNLTGPHRAAGDGGPANGNAPAWSPDGTKIAYGRDGNIWVMNADGSNPTPLATSTRGEFRPEWSPAGAKIAYDRDGRIWVMNADGSAQTQLPPIGSRPAWSPDGSRIVFDSNGNGAPNGHDIFVMNADGSELARLDTPVPASDLDPSWQRIVTLPTDTTPPILSLPVSVAAEATGPEGAVVTYSATATDDIDPSPTVACTPPSGATFPLGETTVTCTATDAAGNQSAGSFAVRVVDTLPPTLSLPGDLTVEASGPGGVAVAYSASAIDLVDSAPTVSCAPASGSDFPVGETTVNCTAIDDAGNAASGSFGIRVVVTADANPPVLSLPAGLTFEATGPGGAPVTYSVSATDDVDPAPSVTCAPLSGSVFPLGTTKVTCTASDSAGNAASRAFFVDVVDTTPPVLEFEKLTTRIETWEFFGTTFSQSVFPGATYPAGAHDLVDPAPAVVCDPQPKARLPVGSTTVRCAATDFSGNTSAGAVEIVVVGPAEALQRLIDTLIGLQLGNRLVDKLLTPLARTRIAFQKGAMANAEKALAQFELELEKQSKKGLSSEAAAKLGTGVRLMQAGTFPQILSAIADRLRRIGAALQAHDPSAFGTLRALLASSSNRLLVGDRTGALKDLRDAKAALADERDKLSAKDAADLARDLDAAIASLAGPKG